MNEAAASKNTITVHVTFGTIKDMQVELPAGGYNVMMMIDAFATSFVNYMCKGCLCSDEVLFSSIGESNCRKAMVLGIEEKFNQGLINEECRNVFVTQIKNDCNWKSAVLYARYPKAVAQKKYWKILFPTRSDEYIDNLIEKNESILAEAS